jgi:hypothetical protein
MRRSLPALLALALSLVSAVVAADPPVPEHNARTLREPAPRPAVGDAADKARRLFEAIRTDQTTAMDDFFLPRDAFRLIKAIANPDHRHGVLLRAFHEDIHELHESLRGLDTATFDRFELVRRGEWVIPGAEGNRLPYWASRHSRIHYTTNGRHVTFEVRVLITWDDHWFVTHLNEVH